jgi:hypothetical protein
MQKCHCDNSYYTHRMSLTDDITFVFDKERPVIEHRLGRLGLPSKYSNFIYVTIFGIEITIFGKKSQPTKSMFIAPRKAAMPFRMTCPSIIIKRKCESSDLLKRYSLFFLHSILIPSLPHFTTKSSTNTAHYEVKSVPSKQMQNS